MDLCFPLFGVSWDLQYSWNVRYIFSWLWKFLVRLPFFFFYVFFFYGNWSMEDIKEERQWTKSLTKEHKRAHWMGSRRLYDKRLYNPPKKERYTCIFFTTTLLYTIICITLSYFKTNFGIGVPLASTIPVLLGPEFSVEDERR